MGRAGAKESLGLGLIGTGFMGKCHALAFRQAGAIFGDLPPVGMELLCDIELALAQRKAEEWGFARACDDWKRLVTDPAIDIVAITSPNKWHRDMAIAAAQAGKAVYCEKPMGLILADGEAMARAVEEKGVVSLLGYNYLRHPLIRHARKLIDEGMIGRVIHFRGFCDEDYFADADKPFSWRCTIQEAGRGTLGDLACHLVSLAHFLVGPIRRVLGDIDIAHPERRDDKGNKGRVENEDMAHALVRFVSGASGVLCSSRTAWGKKNYLAFEIHGEKGMIAFDQERMNELKLYHAGRSLSENGFTTILAGPQHPPYGNFVPAPGHQLGFIDLKIIEVAELISAVNQGRKCSPDFQEGLAIERVIHGIVRSAKEGGWVEVDT